MSRRSILLTAKELKKERWLAIAGFEGLYEVSDMGRVRSLGRRVWRQPSSRNPDGCYINLKETILTPTASAKGYLSVTLWREHEKRQRSVHTLVADAFLGERPPGKLACHRNGVPKNCRLTNIYWGSPSENQADRKRHGTYLQGEQSPVSKLRKHQVDAIRQMAGTVRQVEIAKLFGISQAHVSGIVLGKFWKGGVSDE